ncbi:MAG TPA: hypothetical protein VGP24_13275 [Glaciihabitans sp.]|jgi:hypothetical protein|nr:hypothetical protein [Glaciihabitans sp.]
MFGAEAVSFLQSVASDTRVVVRFRLDSGATDALGFVHDRTADSCTVETRRGLVTIALADVIAAKPVPPAPERRRPRISPDKN